MRMAHDTTVPLPSGHLVWIHFEKNDVPPHILLAGPGWFATTAIHTGFNYFGPADARPAYGRVWLGWALLPLIIGAGWSWSRHFKPAPLPACPSCGYDLTGSPAPLCSECGNKPHP